MLTAYDVYTAEIFDEAGIPVLLVGDSAAQQRLRLETPAGDGRRADAAGAGRRTRRKARAGRRRPAVRQLPGRPRAGADTAFRFMKEGGAHAVKLEGGARWSRRSRRWPASGIPVMAHIGFTPQSEHALGGYRVQGRGDAGGGSSRTRWRCRRPGRSRSSWRWCRRDVAAAGDRRSW